MRKALITGCAGMIGANLSRHLLERGWQVEGVDDLSGGYEEFLPSHPHFQFHAFSLEDAGRLRRLCDEVRPECVYHLAAYAAEGLSPFIRGFNYRNNVVTSAHVINECVRHNAKLVFTSSMAVYGEPPPPFVETMTPAPVDPYGIAKYAVEMDIRQAAAQFGLRYTILRPHNVLGLYQNIWDRYRNVVGIFLHSTLKGEPMLIYGDGEQTRAFTDVRYCLEPMARLADGHDHEVYNIGADRHLTVKAIAETVRQVAAEHGLKAEVRHVEARHEVKHAWCDHTKVIRELGFRDETRAEELVAEMFRWARTQPDRVLKKMDYEIDKGMYSFWK